MERNEADEKMAKKVLVILGHPRTTSFCGALVDAYCKGAGPGTAVRRIHVGELHFNPDYDDAEPQSQELESVLQEARESILWCTHLVIVTPVWWASVPARFKAFLDRVFVSGFAFEYRKDSLLWSRLLKGRSAHIILTAGASPMMSHIAVGNSTRNMLEYGVLAFCGFSPISVTEIGPVPRSSEDQREQWINEIQNKAEEHQST